MSALSDDRGAEVDLQDLVASADTGARNPAGPVGVVLAGVALVWSLFQLYYASHLPYILYDLTGINLILNSDDARSIHLAFALALAATAYPLFSTSPRNRVPWSDLIMEALGVACCLFLIAAMERIANRARLPLTARMGVP